MNCNPCEIVAAILAFAGTSIIPFTHFQTAFVHADIDEGGFSLAASPTKSLIHNAEDTLSFLLLNIKIHSKIIGMFFEGMFLNSGLFPFCD